MVKIIIWAGISPDKRSNILFRVTGQILNKVHKNGY